MPKWVEDCVSKIEGINPRTGKPYTEEEKWAICQAAWKKKQQKAERSDKVIVDESKADFEKRMNACHRKMLSTGKAKNIEEAHQLCLRELSRANYDMDKLESNINKGAV